MARQLAHRAKSSVMTSRTMSINNTCSQTIAPLSLPAALMAFREVPADGSPLTVRMQCLGGCTSTSTQCTNNCVDLAGTDCVRCPCTSRQIDSTDTTWLDNSNSVTFVTDCGGGPTVTDDLVPAPSPPPPSPPPPSPSPPS
eukprot:scaffold81533_cov54-Phaeocystis_antarctica.AAC.1